MTIQNMHLAAPAMGLGSLRFTFFDRKALREILGIPGAKTPLALVCIGKPGGAPQQIPRKPFPEKVTYME